MDEDTVALVGIRPTGAEAPGPTHNSSAATSSQEVPTHDVLHQTDVLNKVFCWYEIFTEFPCLPYHDPNIPHAQLHVTRHDSFPYTQSSDPQPLNRLRRVSDLANAAMVCRSWCAAARDDQPWQNIYVRQYGEPSPWETCTSYREQCARRVGIRRPYPSPSLPGAPAPGATLEAYDRQYGVRTLTVSYDPVSRALVRAVRSWSLVGHDDLVAVQAIPLEPHPPSSAAAAASPETAAATGAIEPVSDGTTAPAAGGGGGTDADVSIGSLWLCMLTPDGRSPATRPSTLPDVASAAAAADGLRAVAASKCVGDVGGSGGGGGGEGEGEGVMHLTEESVRQIASLAELLPTVMCCGGGLLYLPAGPMGHGLAVWDLTTTSTTITTITTSTTMTMTALSSATGGGCSKTCYPSPLLKRSVTAAASPLPLPYWLISEPHPGRLLAVAADGELAVSGCDGGRLCFWQGRQRVALGVADISDLTQLPVLDIFPIPAARAGSRRHRLWISVCEASGLAAVVLTSPQAPVVHIFRAAPRKRGISYSGGGGGGTDGGAECSGGVGQRLATQIFGGAPSSGLLLYRRQMLTMQVMCSDVMGARFGGSGGSSVRVTLAMCLWNLPMEGEEEGGEAGEEEGGGGGDEVGGGHWSDSWTRLFSSRLQLEHPRTLVLGRMRPVMAASEDLLLLTVPHNVGGRPPHSQVLALELPPPLIPPSGATRGSLSSLSSDEEEIEEEEDDEEADGEGDGIRGLQLSSKDEGAGSDGCRAGVEQERGSRRVRHVRHVRQPQLHGGFSGMMVIPEEERLQWIEVVEDANEVVSAMVPTPRHLALLSEGGRLRLYGIIPEDVVPWTAKVALAGGS
ncbi:hypothetical protein VOLCADRAFT_90380 [Volvox carteri f. nagariensis]|uniref:F-box domain-containing protein n=1 Tax=Volvox carteri f. nagariensis TaxID=3068 RepID=D8TU80_VOLCA|nr:uncharacterized protein VOLCADRAFT_90380 [Volvox carteri f. nagariensis]EFJ49100.1 hypothetical protein VOLCADRAFT_90380 [Volvox carteri f. nagariensis]|eukprot:XP_002949997.1 hypothetical protein VOLCADRAFT_90380 [Volvox carteri f. nagariensis]